MTELNDGTDAAPAPAEGKGKGEGDGSGDDNGDGDGGASAEESGKGIDSALEPPRHSSSSPAGGYPYYQYGHGHGPYGHLGQPGAGGQAPPAPPYGAYWYPGAMAGGAQPAQPPPPEHKGDVGAKRPSDEGDNGEGEFKVYNSRWIMLGYMSMLNLLSDWTCYSIAPIALLTVDAFGDVDPESLVTIFLGANAFASAMEPCILGRLGLRRTVLLGSMLLMVGSIVKSGGVPLVEAKVPTQSRDDDEDFNETWKLYLGFFLVGLSQPLYQCTPALLSSSWFPENERTMATGVALNSNQLGIGCAFVFGTLLVATVDDILPYFGLLSVISTITFIGTALQFDDAPPTPPSDTARVIRGTLEIKIPNFFRGGSNKSNAPAPAPAEEYERAAAAVAAAPSPASSDQPADSDRKRQQEDAAAAAAAAGVPPGNPPYYQGPPPPFPPAPYYMYPPPPPGAYPYGGPPPPGYAYPGQHGKDDHDHQLHSSLTPAYYHGYDQNGHYHNDLLYESELHDDHFHDEIGEGVEPIITQTDHHLDIDIRDDQIVQQFKACFARPGFAHCVVAFTTSGIVINTISTYMDYLVTLEGAGREYVGIVGGTFQALIMASSLVAGAWTDKSRKYYFVILIMLILGAFALSVCNVNLDADAGGDLRINLLIVAVFTGPLQPISTELGVEVVYPLSENTVLVIQQLFSNLLSAAFIPVFKMLRDVGTAEGGAAEGLFEVPQYTFSFYLLIIIHACSTAYFATFNGGYLRFEAEKAKKAKKENQRLLAPFEEEENRASYGTAEVN